MLLNLIELACNQALEHDDGAKKQLQSLQGKLIVVEIKNINQRIAIRPLPHGIELARPNQQQPHVTLSATTNALAKIARHGMDEADLEPGELEISGDPIIAQRFSSLATNLDVDWEGLLSEHFGELPAAFVSKGVNTARALFNEGSAALKIKINQALKDDLELVADSGEVEQFLEDVDSLRASVDRLQARLKRIQAA